MKANVEHEHTGGLSPASARTIGGGRCHPLGKRLALCELEDGPGVGVGGSHGGCGKNERERSALPETLNELSILTLWK